MLSRKYFLTVSMDIIHRNISSKIRKTIDHKVLKMNVQIRTQMITRWESISQWREILFHSRWRASKQRWIHTRYSTSDHEIQCSQDEGCSFDLGDALWRRRIFYSLISNASLKGGDNPLDVFELKFTDIKTDPNTESCSDDLVWRKQMESDELIMSLGNNILQIRKQITFLIWNIFLEDMKKKDLRERSIKLFIFFWSDHLTSSHREVRRSWMMKLDTIKNSHFRAPCHAEETEWWQWYGSMNDEKTK